jgi:hypothetical protein
VPKAIAKILNEKWNVGALQSNYRKDGSWYHCLTKFPGALFDEHGYIRFETQQDYESCPDLKINYKTNHTNPRRRTIKTITGYRTVVDPPTPDSSTRPFSHGSEAIAQLRLSDADTTPFDPTNITDAREKIMRAIKERRGQKRFRDALLVAYGGCCAITGCNIMSVLEAAHVTAYRGSRTNHVTNGLLLRADLHTLLDCELLAIEPATRTIILDPTIRHAPDYKDLHGKRIREPEPPAARPSVNALKSAWPKRKGMSVLVPKPELLAVPDPGTETGLETSFGATAYPALISPPAPA